MTKEQVLGEAANKKPVGAKPRRGRVVTKSAGGCLDGADSAHAGSWVGDNLYPSGANMYATGCTTLEFYWKWKSKSIREAQKNTPLFGVYLLKTTWNLPRRPPCKPQSCLGSPPAVVDLPTTATSHMISEGGTNVRGGGLA